MSDTKTITIDSGASLLAMVSGAGTNALEEDIRVEFDGEPSNTVISNFLNEFDSDRNL